MTADSRSTPGPAGRTTSPLRKARTAVHATLDQVCADLDRLSATGSCGITPTMLSGWELGRHSTSPKYRRLLTDYYGQTAETLFADQDEQLLAGEESPALLVGYRDLRRAMTDVVAGAREYLAVTGSRSRDAVYLRAIEDAVADRPELVLIRVLFGPPHHYLLKEHVLRLLELRDPHDRSLGIKTLCLGMIEDPMTQERFICASENAAVVPIPSLTSAQAFDSGVRLGPKTAERMLDHARQCYAAARRVETAAEARALPVLKNRAPDRAPEGTVTPDGPRP